MSNTFDKLSVLDSFIEEVNSYLPEIEANLERLTQSPGDMEALEETYRRTHTIGGSASMMDFPGMAHVAHGMEDILGDVLDGLTSLDLPTIALLQRSLGRLHRLVDGIRHGVDENAMMAEDDEDYSRYRAQQEMAAQGITGALPTLEFAPQQSQSPTAPQPALGAAGSSFDEMLASFRAPMEEEVAWPEEPVIRAEFPPRSGVALPVPPMQPAQHAQFEPQMPVEKARPVMPPPSALELLAGTSKHQKLSPMPPTPSSAMPLTPHSQVADGNGVAYSMAGPIVFPPVPPAPVNASSLVLPTPTNHTTPTAPLPSPAQMSPAFSGMLPSQPPVMPPQPPQKPVRGVVLGNPSSSSQGLPSQDFPAEPASSPQVYQDLQGEARALEDQAASLQRTLAQLRLAASVIEAQRAEFKGFLDGSRDALDRMEDWAGKAMGLNLRNSPEQVRRYLPLSVMWVANSKLKKVLDMLVQMTAGVEGTDEQMRILFEQLHSSLFACGEIFQRFSPAPDGVVFTKDAGWSSWDMQVNSDPIALRERVTFERQGDMQALRAEIERELRDELSAEYENRPATLAARAEMQRQIREELREEFDAKQRLQAHIAGVETSESVQELEDRLRNEIEIQVRSEFLSRLEQGGSPLLSQMNYVEAPAPVVPASMPIVQSVKPLAPPPPKPQTASQPMVSDFADEATEIFRLEAEEHLQTISMYVATLEHAPTNLEPIQGIRRATHTLKGAAGMMGFRAIADLCHVSEDMLDGIMEGNVAISSIVLSLILDTAEALDALITGKGSPAENEQVVQSLRERYVELLGEQTSLAQLSDEEIELDDEQEVGRASMASVVDNAPQNLETSIPGMARTDLSVRVSLSKLDELVNLFGELLVNRTILEERIQRLSRLVGDASVSSARLRDVGQRLESRFEAATLPSGRSVQTMPGEGTPTSTLPERNEKEEPAHLAEFDELELDRYTEFHQLARGLSEGISDMTTLSTEMDAIIRDTESTFGRESRLSTTFQDRLMKARLVPISTMISRLYRTARAVALKQHKEFELVLEGQGTEVDRTVIEEIAGPLLHLMRNAVNHALEVPEMRLQRGKPAVGQIKLSAAYEGNQVVITVRDDGVGLDTERIRSEAINRGLIHPSQALDSNEIVELIFRQGFSTAEVLSEESGRGVGLDVVRDSVARLRGTLEVESMVGQGTAFTMKFPTSLAIQNAMMVIVADQQFAIPTVMVESIGRLDSFKHSNYAGRPSIVNQNQHYPLSSLAQLLDLPVSELNDKAPILLIHTARHRVALVVDDIKGRMDVVIKNLGPHLRNVHGITGGTVLGNGHVVLILELLELLSTRPGTKSGLVASAYPEATPGQARVQVERRTTIAPVVPAQKPAEAVAQGKHILVVDDSPSVRRVVSNMLKQHNWEVQTARDGVEALEMITKETPAAALLDIEMPRMDGYELIATVRAQEQYRTLPLIMLTSRAATKHQQRAMQLGASAYVVKPYQDEELINILNALVYGASA